MKKIILLFAMMIAVAGVQAQSVHKLYAVPMQVSGNSNITWNESTKQFSVTAAGSNTYDIFSFPAGTLSKYAKIHISIANTTDRVLFMKGTEKAFTWSGFGSTGQKDQTLVGLNSNSQTLSAETIATITSIRIAGPESGTISTPYTIGFDPSATYLETASCEAMEITTTINSSSTKDTPFAWTATGTLSTIENNFGKTTSAVLFGYSSNNDAEHGIFDVTGYDRVQVKLNSYDSSKNKEIRLLAGTGSDHLTFSALENVTTYEKPIASFTTCSSIKAGQGASDSQDVTSIVFSKYFGTAETTAFSIAASASSTIAYDREFTAGRKCTVCLPFSLDKTEMESYGAFYYLNSVNNGNLEFMKASNSVSAYTPYIFVPNSSGKLFANLTNKAIVASPGQTMQKQVGNGAWTFQGTLAHVASLTQAGNTLYGWNAENGNFVKVGSNVSINAFRAYITGPAESGEGSVKSLTAVFNDDATTTAIQQVQSAPVSKAMYNLAGQRVSDSYKGIVIKNGKKMIVK